MFSQFANFYWRHYFSPVLYAKLNSSKEHQPQWDVFVVKLFLSFFFYSTQKKIQNLSLKTINKQKNPLYLGFLNWPSNFTYTQNHASFALFSRIYDGMYVLNVITELIRSMLLISHGKGRLESMAWWLEREVNPKWEIFLMFVIPASFKHYSCRCFLEIPSRCFLRGISLHDSMMIWNTFSGLIYCSTRQK